MIDLRKADHPLILAGCEAVALDNVNKISIALRYAKPH